MPKYEVEVALTGQDGNAFSILGQVRRALLNAGADQNEVAEFMRDAMSGDYDHLLQVVSEWVEVC